MASISYVVLFGASKLLGSSLGAGKEIPPITPDALVDPSKNITLFFTWHHKKRYANF